MKLAKAFSASFYVNRKLTDEQFLYTLYRFYSFLDSEIKFVQKLAFKNNSPEKVLGFHKAQFLVIILV